MEAPVEEKLGSLEAFCRGRSIGKVGIAISQLEAIAVGRGDEVLVLCQLGDSRWCHCEQNVERRIEIESVSN